MRLATFNVENLFSRPAAMNLESWAEGRPVLDDVAALAALLAKTTYDDNNKAQITEILDRYGFGDRDRRNRPFTIQQVREKLFTVPPGSDRVRVVANGRADWVGWIDLVREDLPGDQIVNTGRVITAVEPDVLCIVEVEDRIALDRFNRQVLGNEFGNAFKFDLLIDGNDPRGIDIGLLSHHRITSICSHIHDVDAEGRIFNRDAPEYEIELTDDQRLWVIGNHFKSKGYGDQAANDARRRRQAEQVRSIYLQRRERFDFVAIVGDLNDVPTSEPLEPLVTGTDLRDVSLHPDYDDQGRPGTFDTGRPEQKIDYILLSPALWERVQGAGIERRGIYAPRTFPHFPEVTSDRNSASDHAALWVDLDLGV
ncbi:MAG TPA: endonuclease/exonuclease/phosphatase family protein [Longimicrobium sp.]|jgi:endonuclease/exonuclease/phosphatase family metal-dependent hydrolase